MAARRLAFFYGPWTESEERSIEEAIHWKESHAKLPPRKLGEPWVVMRQYIGDEYVFLAHRHGWPSPVEASSPDELASAIRDSRAQESPTAVFRLKVLSGP